MEISSWSSVPYRSPEVRSKVEACGICHSDAIAKEGLMPGISYPRVPGREIAGRVQVQRILTGVRPMIESFPLERAADAYEHMMANKARFRTVLTIATG